MDTKNEWQTGKPPNEEIVEVELDGEIIKVMAFYGRDGYLPHWKTPDGNIYWTPSMFKRWRYIQDENQHSNQQKIKDICIYCQKEKTIMSKNVVDPNHLEWCGESKAKDLVSSLEYTLGVFIDIRGYLRLVDLDDFECLDSGEKIEISFCPICGEKIKKQY